MSRILHSTFQMQTNHVFIESSIIIPYLFPSKFLMNLSFLEFQVMRADKSILLTHMLATYIIMNTPATQTLLLFLKAAWEEGYLWMRAHMYTYMQRRITEVSIQNLPVSLFLILIITYSTTKTVIHPKGRWRQVCSPLWFSEYSILMLAMYLCRDTLSISNAVF